MKLITGATKEAHITANNDGEFKQGLWGDGLVVLANGSRLGFEIVSSTNVRIKDGDLVFQGRHALIEAGTYDTVNLSSGQSGYNRIDLIVVHYESGQNGYESMSLKVIQGTATTGTPSVPSYTTGTIRTGSLIAESPLYEVLFTGVNIALRMIPPVYDPMINMVNSKQPIITGAVSSVVDSNLDANKIVVTDNRGKLAQKNVSADKINFLTNVTSDIQSQLNAKQSAITGSASTITSNTLNSGKIVITDADGKMAVSDTSSDTLQYIANLTEDVESKLQKMDLEKGSPFNTGMAIATDDNHKLVTSNTTKTELDYLHGVTSAVQTQIDSKLDKSTITADRVVISNNELKAITSPVSSSELNVLSGILESRGTLNSLLDAKQDKITSSGAISDIVNQKIDDKNRALISNNSGNVATSTATKDDLAYIAGVGGNPKSGSLYNAITSKLNKSDWTESRVMVSNNKGNIAAHSTVTTSDLGHIHGLTSNAQTQLNSKLTTSKIKIDTTTTAKSSSNVKAESGKATALGNFSISAGKWVVVITVSWDSAHKDGYRTIWLSNGTSSTGGAIGIAHMSRIAASPSGNTIQQLVCFLNPSSTKTYYIVGQQNSGKTLSVDAVRYSYMGVQS